MSIPLSRDKRAERRETPDTLNRAQRYRAQLAVLFSALSAEIMKLHIKRLSQFVHTSSNWWAELAERMILGEG